jgi:hypothetical protein
MCGGGSFFSDPFKGIGDLVSGAGHIFEDIGKTISSVVSTIGKTIDSIVHNPLPTIETVVLSAAGVPYPIAAAAVSAANGGNIQNIALSAAAAYAGGQVGQWAGSNVPGIEGLDKTTQNIIQQAVTSSSGSALAAAISGKPLDQILTAGAAGAISGAVAGELKNQGFDSADLSTKLINNATNAAAKAIISGKSIGAAITQSSVVAAMNWSLEGASNQIKNTYNELSSQSETLQAVNNQFNSLKAEAQNFFQNTLDPAQINARAKYDTANGLYAQFNDLQGQYTSKLNEYNQAKSDWNNFASGNTSYANDPTLRADYNDNGDLVSYTRVEKVHVDSGWDPERGYIWEHDEYRPVVVSSRQEYDPESGSWNTVNTYETITSQTLVDKANALAPQINDIANRANSVASQYQTAADAYQTSLGSVNAAKSTYDGYVRDLTTLQNQAANVAQTINQTSETLGNLVGQAAIAEQTAANEQLQRATQAATNQIIDETNTGKLVTPEAKQAYADAVASSGDRKDAFTQAQNTDANVRVAQMDPEVQKAFSNVVSSGQSPAQAFGTAEILSNLSPTAQAAFNNDYASSGNVTNATTIATGVNNLSPDQQTTYSDIYGKTGSTANALAAAPTLTNASDIAVSSYYDSLKNNLSNDQSISIAAGVKDLSTSEQQQYADTYSKTGSTVNALQAAPVLTGASDIAKDSYYEALKQNNGDNQNALNTATTVKGFSGAEQAQYADTFAKTGSVTNSLQAAPVLTGASDIAKDSYYETLKQNNNDNQLALSTAASVNKLPSDQQGFYQFNATNGLSTTDALKYTPELSKVSTTALQSFYDQKNNNASTADAMAWANKVNSLSSDQQLSYSTAKANGLSADTAMKLAPSIAGNTAAEQNATINAVKQGYGSQAADFITAFGALGDTTGAKLVDQNATNLAKLSDPNAKALYNEALVKNFTADEALALAQGYQQSLNPNAGNAVAGPGGLLETQRIANSTYMYNPATKKYDILLPDPKTGTSPSGSGDLPVNAEQPIGYVTDEEIAKDKAAGTLPTLAEINAAVLQGRLNEVDAAKYAAAINAPASDVVTKPALEDYFNYLFSPAASKNQSQGTGTGTTGTGTGAGTTGTGTGTTGTGTGTGGGTTGTGTGGGTTGTGAGTGTTGTGTGAGTTGTGTGSGATGTGTGGGTTGTGTGGGTTGTGTGGGTTGTGTGGGGTGGTGTGGDGTGTGGGGTGTGGTGGGTTIGTTTGSTYKTPTPLVSDQSNAYGGIKNLTPGLTAKMDYTLTGEPVINESLNPMTEIPSFATGGSAASSSTSLFDSSGNYNYSNSTDAGSLKPGLTQAQLSYILAGLPGNLISGHANGGSIQAPQGFQPQFFSQGGLEAATGTHVRGEGDGTSDDVAAMLSNGEYVIPADVVSKLGNGSNDAGAGVLDQFLSTIREQANSNGDKLPPKAKAPLAYLLDAKRNVKA